MIGLPSSSYCTSSYSACATPCAIPPCCWPATSNGLTIVPQSSTAMWRSSSTRPVSASISTTAMCEPNGNDEPPGVEVELVLRVALRHALGPARRVLRRGRELGPRRACSRARPRPRARRRRHDVVGVRLEQVRGELLRLREHLLARDGAARCRRSGASASRRCRRPAGPRRCRSARRARRSIGTPSASLTIIANAVSWPWPCALVPTRAVTVPSSSISTARTRG